MMNNLKIFRDKKGITQKVLAEKADLSIRSYQRYETGERTPNTFLAQKLALLLETTVSELFPLND